jgi:SAM-dependent methyltransferase
LEMDAAASRFCRESLGLAVQQGRLEDAEFPAGSFDVVALSHVFEHLGDPHASLQRLRKWLKPGGILVLTVPNGDSWMRQLFGRCWFGYDIPRHYFVYGREAVARLAQSHGFIAVEMGTLYGSYTALLTSLALVAARTRPSLGLSGLVRILSHPLCSIAFSALYCPIDALGGGEGLTCILRRCEAT